jgi:hypothetical protein
LNSPRDSPACRSKGEIGQIRSFRRSSMGE